MKRVMMAATGIVARMMGNAHAAPTAKSANAEAEGREIPIAAHDSDPVSTTRSRMRPM